MIASNDLVRDTKGSEVFRRHFVANGGTSKKLGRVVWVVVAIFGFSQIAQTHQGDVVLVQCIVQQGHPVFATSHVIFHFARIQMQITQDGHRKVRGRRRRSRRCHGGRQFRRVAHRKRRNICWQHQRRRESQRRSSTFHHGDAMSWNQKQRRIRTLSVE